MMLRKNNKGFTMVEMLATVVIMGILASIGIVSVVHLRANQKAKFNQSQTEIFRQTAKNYFTDNKRKLPAVLMSPKDCSGMPHILPVFPVRPGLFPHVP